MKFNIVNTRTSTVFTKEEFLKEINSRCKPDDPTIDILYSDGNMLFGLKSDSSVFILQPKYELVPHIGKTDVDGIDLYEGCVIKSDNYKYTHLIKFEKDEGVFMAWHLPITEFSSGPMSCTQRWLTEHDKRCIGNMHENPELLKGN